MPSTGGLPQKQKSAAPGVLMGQRHRSLLSSNNEQLWPLWIGSSLAAGMGTVRNAFCN
jgi:hypothetical protein